jgi:hypothetical protein
MNWKDELFPKIDIPWGSSGNWKVEKFKVTEKEAEMFNTKLIFSGSGSRMIEAGEYTRLMHCNECIMSDTPRGVGGSYFSCAEGSRTDAC